MFFEDGWVPLSEVTSEVFRRLQGFHAAGAIPGHKGPLTPILALSVWDICEACAKIGVTGPDGAVVPASTDLIAWADPRSLSNEHIDVTQGSVGSSKLPDAEGNVPTLDELKLRYGPFLTLPVVIPINSFQSSLTFLEEEVCKQNPRDEPTVQAARTIIEMKDSGALLTRDIARTKLGASVSRRKLKAAWALAAHHRPDLALPNRWAGL